MARIAKKYHIPTAEYGIFLLFWNLFSDAAGLQSYIYYILQWGILYFASRYSHARSCERVGLETFRRQEKRSFRPKAPSSKPIGTVIRVVGS